MTSSRDRDLGMDRKISRRDFVSGALVAAGTVALPISAFSDSSIARPARSSGEDYPPARTGMRGNHPGSFEVMHAVAREGATPSAGVLDPKEPVYDLVVVGAGASGLAAAHFYLQRDPDARILILDNHDDFGGHAKRNEQTVRGQTLISAGGSGLLQNPDQYSDESKQLLDDLAVDLDGFSDAYDRDFYRRHGLRYATYFDEATYGESKLVFGDFLETISFFEMAKREVSLEQWVASLPIPDTARRQVRSLFEKPSDKLPDVPFWKLPDFLNGISYDTLLRGHLGITEPKARGLFNRSLTEIGYGVGIDSITALECLFVGMPGFSDVGLHRIKWLLNKGIEAYLGGIYNFPDGNASIARLLVRKLVPGSAPGSTMDDIILAPFDYGTLDREENPVRIRLESTVLRVAHRGSVDRATEIDVDYSREGSMRRVRTKRVVMACYNMAIPYLCPELPDEQRKALASLVKMPIVMTSIALRNWGAIKRAGLRAANCPGAHYHSMFELSFPHRQGGYEFSDDPEQPMTVGLAGAPGETGLTPREQYRIGRHRLLGMSFEDFERDIRSQLAGMLSHAGFDPAADIAGITVNRWPHDYAHTYLPLFDGPFEPGEAPHEIGRRRFGRIAIANSDSEAKPYLDGAIDAGARAVSELLA